MRRRLAVLLTASTFLAFVSTRHRGVGVADQRVVECDRRRQRLPGAAQLDSCRPVRADHHGPRVHPLLSGQRPRARYDLLLRCRGRRGEQLDLGPPGQLRDLAGHFWRPFRPLRRPLLHFFGVRTYARFELLLAQIGDLPAMRTGAPIGTHFTSTHCE